MHMFSFAIRYGFLCFVIGLVIVFNTIKLEDRNTSEQHGGWWVGFYVLFNCSKSLSNVRNACV